MHSTFSGISGLGLTAVLLISVAGCGGNGEAQYIPTEATARESLNVVLKAWQDGQAHGTVTSYRVPIDTFDARWQAAKKLEKFEIVREETVDDKKSFIVKMKLADEAEQEVTYLVIGNDPLMVFRKQDYDKASGMGEG